MVEGCIYPKIHQTISDSQGGRSAVCLGRSRQERLVEFLRRSSREYVLCLCLPLTLSAVFPLPPPRLLLLIF